MNWQSYEDLVRYVYEQLGKLSSIEIVCHGHACRVTGKSGVDHQIDVLTRHSDGIHSYRTAIECKYWKEKVSKDAVTKLAEILEDSKIEKGVIVSSAGFTSDAVSFASYKNISLVQLCKPDTDFWQDRIKNIVVTIHTEIPSITSFQIIQPADHVGKPDNFSVPSTDIIFCSDGREQSAAELIEAELRRRDRKELDPQKFEITFAPGSEIRIAGEDFRSPVEAVHFSVKYSTYETKAEIKGEEYISMIMRCIFEDKEFIVYKNGQVLEADF